MALFIFLAACDNDDDDNDNPDPATVYKEYSGSGSEGDLLSFEINHTDQTYIVYNETTGEEDNGSYTIMEGGNMDGIYQVSADGDQFYAVELTDKILAANFPTGNPNNTISFGVSAALDNTGNTGNIAGEYIFMVMDNTGLMGDAYIKEWGILSVNANNTWLKTNYATNTGDGSIPEMSPEQYTGSLPLTAGDESGTWQVNGDNAEQLDVVIDGAGIELTGYIYATASEAAFVLDLGTGNGFLLGLKVTGSSFASVAGDYKFINVWDNGLGAGNYSIDESGMVNWYHNGSDGGSSGSFQLTQCSNVFTNVFYCENVQMEQDYYEKLYCVIVGDIIMHFSFDNDNGNFAQYGAGARL